MRQANKRSVFSWFAALVILSLIAGGCAQATPALPPSPAQVPASTAMPAPPTYTPMVAAAAVTQAAAGAQATAVVEATNVPASAANGAAGQRLWRDAARRCRPARSAVHPHAGD